VEILRNLDSRFKIYDLKFIVAAAFILALSFVSCSRKPAELYNDGMKSFVAGDYGKAQENFADGIKKGGSDSLYAGFIAANLVTGKYAPVNSAYNDFCDGIHQSLVKVYGARAVKMVGVTSGIIPYKTGGGNKLPQDFPQTIDLQAMADYQGFIAVKQQIDKVVKQ
jgi:hypothetical protein